MKAKYTLNDVVTATIGTLVFDVKIVGVVEENKSFFYTGMDKPDVRENVAYHVVDVSGKNPHTFYVTGGEIIE